MSEYSSPAFVRICGEWFQVTPLYGDKAKIKELIGHKVEKALYKSQQELKDE